MKKGSMMNWLRRLDEWRENGVDYEEEVVRLELQLNKMDKMSVEAGGLCSRLGAAYGELENFQAELTYYRMALSISREVLGVDCIEVADMYLALGDVYMINDLYDLSELSYWNALCIYKLRCRESEQMVNVCCALGHLYVEMDRFEDALLCYKGALRVCRGVFGERHTLMADVYSDVGLTLFCLERYDEALGMYERGLDIREQLLGTMHVDSARSYYMIGEVYYCLLEPVFAMDNYEIALKIQLQVLEPDDVELGNTYEGLGTTLLYQNGYEAAIENFEEAMSIYQGVLDDNDGSFVSLYDGLGECYYRLGMRIWGTGNVQEAVECMELAKGYLEKVSGPTVINLDMVYDKLGNLYQEWR